MATEAIAFPAKGVGVIEASGDVLPFPSTLFQLVCISCHDSKVDDSFLVRDIRTQDFV